MADVLGSVEWVAEFIPDVADRIEPFVVDTEDVDDELIAVFVEELQRLTGELEDGLNSSDLDVARMSAHSIKGMGGTIGLPEISVLGLHVELLAKESNLEGARPMVDALSKWINGINLE